jgi:hypothetical protein
MLRVLAEIVGAKSGLVCDLYCCCVDLMSVIAGPHWVSGDRGVDTAWRLDAGEDLLLMLLLLLMLIL